MTTVRQLAVSELGRIAASDRPEDTTAQCRSCGATLELVDVEIRVPRQGPLGAKAMQHDIDGWTGLVGAGGALLGVFDSDRLVGLAVDEPSAARLSEGVANAAVLHVARAHRGQGVRRAGSSQVCHQMVAPPPIWSYRMTICLSR